MITPHLLTGRGGSMRKVTTALGALVITVGALIGALALYSWRVGLPMPWEV